MTALRFNTGGDIRHARPPFTDKTDKEREREEREREERERERYSDRDRQRERERERETERQRQRQRHREREREKERARERERERESSKTPVSICCLEHTRVYGDNQAYCMVDRLIIINDVLESLKWRELGTLCKHKASIVIIMLIFVRNVLYKTA